VDGAPLTAGRRFVRDTLVAAAFCALTVAMTWPWAADLRRHSPGPGDPYLMSWALWWDFHAAFTQPLRLFDANLFYPYHDTLAFSEHVFGIALPLFPLLALGVAPLSVHGVATLLGIAFSGFGAFRLARTLTGSTGAGWVSGIVFGFALYRFGQLPHLPYLSTPWMPLVLEALVLFARQPTWRRASWLGVTFVMNGLTAVHWLMLTAIPLAAAGLWLAFREKSGPRHEIAFRGAAALALSGFALLPFLLPYRRVAERHGFVRAEAETRAYSAVPGDWLVPEARSRTWGSVLRADPPAERSLFPGALVALLSGAALLGLTERGTSDARAIGFLWAGLGFLGSLGLNAPFHRFLFEHVAGFQAIRVPARWAMVANLGLALLAGPGALGVARLVASRFRTPLFALLSAALLVDLRVAPLELHRGESDPDPLTLKLGATPMRGGLVELPATPPDVGNARPEHQYVLRAADHGKPLVDATSGFTTKEAFRIRMLSRKRPVPDGFLDLLESIPTSYLTVREAWLLPEEREGLRAFLARASKAGRLRFVGRFDAKTGADLWAVVKTEPESVGGPLPWISPAPDAPIPPESRRDEALLGSVDDPAARTTAAGNLFVRGWARIPGEDLSVSFLVDGLVREPASLVRTDRPDVCRVLPEMADCRAAGYEARLAFSPADAGSHELTVVFRAKDGRVRHFPSRRFDWKG
jgi:hypothetical protein